MRMRMRIAGPVHIVSLSLSFALYFLPGILAHLSCYVSSRADWLVGPLADWVRVWVCGAVRCDGDGRREALSTLVLPRTLCGGYDTNPGTRSGRDELAWGGFCIPSVSLSLEKEREHAGIAGAGRRSVSR